MMNKPLNESFDLSGPVFAGEAVVRAGGVIRLRGDTLVEAPAEVPAPAPAGPRRPVLQMTTRDLHHLWLHICVAVTAVLVVWTTMFTPFAAKAARLDRFAIVLKLAGGDLSDKGLKRYAANLDPAVVRLADRFARENHGGNPYIAVLNQAAAAPDTSGREGATFRYQDFTPEQARIWNALVPVSNQPNPPAKPFMLKSDDVVNYQRAVNCLTAAVYFEAASESQTGQQAVAQVVLNRMRHPAFPKSVCGVVFEGSQLSTGCQFSFTCDGSLNRTPSAEGWQRARKVAIAALGGFVASGVGQATHYHAVYVAPYWSPSLLKVKNIGAHIFYRWMGGSGMPHAFTGVYAGNEPYIARLAMLDAQFGGVVTEAPVLIPAAAVVTVEPSSPADTLGLRSEQAPAAGQAQVAPVLVAPPPVITLQQIERPPAIKAPTITPTPEKAPQRRGHLATPQGW
jgi:spore germination cell wall hydrolase CwlJ-like protein